MRTCAIYRRKAGRLDSILLVATDYKKRETIEQHAARYAEWSDCDGYTVDIFDTPVAETEQRMNLHIGRIVPVLPLDGFKETPRDNFKRHYKVYSKRAGHAYTISDICEEEFERYGFRKPQRHEIEF